MAKNESLTLRLPHKLRYGIELLARKQHRNLSGVMQWLIAEAIADDIDLDKLWDVNAGDRIRKLAKFEPSLLTYEEEVIIKKEGG